MILKLPVMTVHLIFLEDAINRQLVSDVPLCAMLSRGDLDSSIICRLY